MPTALNGGAGFVMEAMHELKRGPLAFRLAANQEMMQLVDTKLDHGCWLMHACQNVDLLTALGQWVSGQKIEQLCIFGMSAIWLGRFAKVLAFFAAVPIVIDIVGEARIQNASGALGRYLEKKSARLQWFANIVSDNKGSIGERAQRATEALAPALQAWANASFRDVSSAWPYVCGALIVLFLFVIGPATEFETTGDTWTLVGGLLLNLGYALMMLVLGLSFLLPLLTLALSGCLKASLRVLEDQRLCRNVRVAALSAFVLAFLMDMIFGS
jgi:hypothetical protein